MVKISTSRINLARKKSERLVITALRKWFKLTNAKILSSIRTGLYKQEFGFIDWSWIEKEGIKILQPAMVKGYVGGRELTIRGSFQVFDPRILERINETCGLMIKDITERTRLAVVKQIENGVREGYSAQKIANNLRPLVGLTENQADSILNFRGWLQEKHPEFNAAQVEKKMNLYADQTRNRRCEVIARTETAQIQNTGYCDGLKDAGVTQVEIDPSPGCCEDCEALRGRKYSLEEGAGVIPVHPQCRCCMLPVV